MDDVAGGGDHESGQGFGGGELSVTNGLDHAEHRLAADVFGEGARAEFLERKEQDAIRESLVKLGYNPVGFWQTNAPLQGNFLVNEGLDVRVSGASALSHGNRTAQRRPRFEIVDTNVA